METLTIHPENDAQLEAIKAVLKALKIPFDNRESPYDQAFVKKVKEAEKDRQEVQILNNDVDINNYFKNLKGDIQD